MKIFNNTGNEVYYSISAVGEGDCGTIASGATTDLPGYDNTPNVNLQFFATPVQPIPVTPFTVTVPETETGKVITIGLYQE